ncbi:hypothetical protein BCV70DRAFT_200009 [Testicularia cyperi]|uniref:Bromo domain-containing protein n=1 Tax=Testicularia cyperi TaxID=1882483 RepID=A0A317XTS4_9BASI|nr:hypothetical protein BCV70DRAFT_200009 [Testicularia cyperi]
MDAGIVDSSSAPSLSSAPLSMQAAQPRRAVMLKGPSLTSKTYFVPLPDTLDQLIAKATQLFAVPPGKVPHITLGSDERAIVLEESFGFIRDRELIHLRWSAGETPKRNLANRVRWDDPSASSAASPLSTTSSPSQPLASSSRLYDSSLSDSLSSASEALKAAQLQNSTTQPKDLVTTTKANTIANRDPHTQFGEGMAARKAHVQRVLDEQKRKQEEENMAEVLGSNVLVDTDMEVSRTETDDASPVDTSTASMQVSASIADDVQNRAEGQTGSSHAQVSLVEESLADSTDAQLSPAEESVSILSGPNPESMALNIESPPRKKHADNVGLDTPPSSGSRSSSPYLSSDRSGLASGQLNMRAEDELSSSPIQSPTRDVSRQKTLLAAEDISAALATSTELVKAMEHGSQMISEPMLIDDTCSGDVGADSVVASAHLHNDLTSQVVNDDQVEEVADALAPADKSTPNKDLDRTYAFLSNLISQLLSHRSNWAFQRPMSFEFEQFSARCSRPVDLFTMRDAITARKYGSNLVSGRMAANAVLTGFEDDLLLLYTNARKFFGVRSTQAECVEHLEKFSRSFINEWKRGQTVVQTPSQAQAQQHGILTTSAAASTGVKSASAQPLRNSFWSPSGRLEKRAITGKPSEFPFGLTTHLNLMPGSTSIKKSASSNSGHMARKPDFLFKRNASYEGVTAVNKRPAQAINASEAFERALRAPSLTPQTDRIKPRQDFVAPFLTRSVIETLPPRIEKLLPVEVMTTSASTGETVDSPSGNRAVPSEDVYVPLTPSKRRLESLQNEQSNREAEAAAKSPSPPPSPSPTKCATLVTLQPVKETTVKKKRARRTKSSVTAAQAAAVAVVSAPVVPIADAAQDDEQAVKELLETGPPQKRAKLENKAKPEGKAATGRGRGRPRKTAVANGSDESGKATTKATSAGTKKIDKAKSKAVAAASAAKAVEELPIASVTVALANAEGPAVKGTKAPGTRGRRSKRRARAGAESAESETSTLASSTTSPRASTTSASKKDTVPDLDTPDMYAIDTSGFEFVAQRRSTRPRKPTRVD